MLSFLLLPCWLAACECRCRHSMPNQGIAMFDQFNFHGGERKFHFNILNIHPLRISFQKRYYLSIYKTTDPQTLKMIAQARGLYLPDFFRPARRPLDGSNPLNWDGGGGGEGWGDISFLSCGVLCYCSWSFPLAFLSISEDCWALLTIAEES